MLPIVFAVFFVHNTWWQHQTALFEKKWLVILAHFRRLLRLVVELFLFVWQLNTNMDKSGFQQDLTEPLMSWAIEACSPHFDEVVYPPKAIDTKTSVQFFCGIFTNLSIWAVLLSWLFTAALRTVVMGRFPEASGRRGGLHDGALRAVQLALMRFMRTLVCLRVNEIQTNPTVRRTPQHTKPRKHV